MACFSLTKVITKRVPNTLKCSYNKGLLIEPVTDECGHVVCEKCFEEQWSKHKRCLVSGQKISNKTKKAKDVDAKLDKVKVSCEGGASDCQWEGNFEDLDKHLKTCLTQNSRQKRYNKRVKEVDAHALTPAKTSGRPAKKKIEKEESELDDSSESSEEEREVQRRKPTKKGENNGKPDPKKKQESEIEQLEESESSEESEESEKPKKDKIGKMNPKSNKKEAKSDLTLAKKTKKGDNDQKEDHKPVKAGKRNGMQIECKNCKQSYLSSEEDYHFDVVCKFNLHLCPFLEAGCDFKGTWEQLDDHTEIEYKKHIELLETNMLQFRDYDSLLKKLLDKIQNTEKELYKKTTEEINQLDIIEMPLIQGKFDTKFKHDKIIFEDDYSLESSPERGYKLVFFSNHFSRNHRVMINIAEISESAEIGFGLADKDYFYNNNIREYRDEDEKHFKLFMTKESQLNFEAPIEFNVDSDYELSFNKKTQHLNIEESNFERDFILSNDFQFDGNFAKWQPVLVIKGGCKIQLTDFCDFNRD